MSRAVFAGLIALGLVGCTTVGPSAPTAVAPPPPPPPMEVATIVGEGVFRTIGGAHASCAGQSVALMADTQRSRGRMIALYGSAAHAVEPIGLVQTRSAKLGPPSDLVNSTQCGPDGHFAFSDLGPGNYFLIGRVRLDRPEAGQSQFVVMQAVSLRVGETKQVRFAP